MSFENLFFVKTARMATFFENPGLEIIFFENRFTLNEKRRGAPHFVENRGFANRVFRESLYVQSCPSKLGRWLSDMARIFFGVHRGRWASDIARFFSARPTAAGPVISPGFFCGSPRGRWPSDIAHIAARTQ